MPNYEDVTIITHEYDMRAGEKYGIISTPVGQMYYVLKADDRPSNSHGLHGGRIRHVEVGWPGSDVLVEFDNGEWRKDLKYASDYARAAYRAVVRRHYNL